MHWYITVLKKYVQFEGRARRKEYWMFALFNLITMLLIGLLSLISETLAILVFVYILAIIVPSVAVSIRRMHDIGKSGWFTLVQLIPFVGGFIFLFFTIQDSQEGENTYGPNPKAIQ